MPLYTDQLNRVVDIPAHPQRIVSLVPSQTELLYDLGLEKEVAGITKFCIYPDRWFREKQRVGGTKSVHLEAVAALQPDLILANKEENTEEQIAALANDFPVWVSDVNNLDSAIHMIEKVSLITGKAEAGRRMTASIRTGFSALPLPQNKPTAAYLIWNNPCMTVGGDTFIHAMLEKAGFENVLASQTRYPTTSMDQIKAARCQLIFLSSEPYPFTDKHRDEWQQQYPAARVMLVDGSMFSWYGSRLLQAPAYFKELHSQIGNLP